MLPSRNQVLYEEQKQKMKAKLNVFTPFKTVAAYFPAIINNKTKNIFPKELYCDLLDINKKTNYKIILKQTNFKDLNSILMKKLESWDKENLGNQKKDPEFLYNSLLHRYKIQNLDDEIKQLNLLNDMIKSKSNFNKFIEGNKTNNKILEEFFEKKNKEQGSILKYNIAKTNTKFNVSLFLTKTQKDIEQDFGVDSQTLNAMNNDEVNSDFYASVIRNNLKYENQLRDELMTVNNFIFDKKFEKKKLMKKLNEIYNEQTKSTREYHDLVNEINYGFEKFQDDFKHKKKKTPKFSQTKTNSKSILYGMRLLKQLNQSENFEQYSKTTTRKLQLQIDLKKYKEEYFKKMRELEIEKEEKQREIKDIDEELSYYKEVNNVLFEEHKQYYLDILKKGYDTRGEGLIWVVRNLLELEINLEYHHFPKFLTHEEIDFLIKRADISLESKQLKIIMNILKKKQSDIASKDNLKKLKEASEILNNKSKDNPNSDRSYRTIDYSSDNLHNYLRVKAQIDKKFLKIYAKNSDMFNRVYTERELEEDKLVQIIEALKQGLFGRFKADKKEKEIIKIFKGDATRRQIFSLLLYIRKRLDVLQFVSDQIINDMITSFKEKEKFTEDNKLSVKVSMQNELVKKCLFGANMYV